MEQEKHHWKNYTNTDYIGAYSLNGKDLTVKITAVSQEKVIGDRGKTEMCMVAQLEGQKAFILNRTNSKTITRVLGSPYIEDWIGKSITLYPTTTSLAGEQVECLRVRPVAPVEVKVDVRGATASLRACRTIDELKSVYGALSKAEQAATVAVKDEVKARLVQSSSAAQTTIQSKDGGAA